MVDIPKNIVTDFGAVGNGSSDDSQKFGDFRTWALANQGADRIVLTLPTGKDFLFDSPVGNGFIFDGINDLIVDGYGATLTHGSAGFHFGATGGVFGDSVHQARTATVARGATSVQLLTPAEHSLFTVGNYALMTGFCLQEDGAPPNLRFFDYVLVNSIDTIDGIISFITTPLKNAYKSTWPYYGPRMSGTDPGGPATLYAIRSTWHLTHLYRGFSIANLDIANSMGRDITFRDVNVDVISGHQGMFPTMSKNWSWYGGSMDCSPEVDKLIDRCWLDGPTFIGLDVQSSSVNLLRLKNVTLTGGMVGSGIRTVITDTTMTSLRPGAYNYGASDSIYVEDTTFTSVIMGGVLCKGSADAGVNVAYTMTDGVIRIPNNVPAAVAAFVPGRSCWWSGADASETGFFVEDVTQDDDYTYVHTNLSGGFPNVALTQVTKLFVRTHPAPSATFKNCVGCADAIDLSQGPAGPIWSHTLRSYTKADSASTPPTMNVLGEVTEIRVAVNVAYAGATNPLTLQLNLAITKPDGARVNYRPVINLRAAGERVITKAGVTGTQTGDSALALPSAVSNWSGGGVNPGFSANVSGQVTSMAFDIEVTTDQGIPGFNRRRVRLTATA